MEPNQKFNGQPIRYGTAAHPPTQVRLWDVLTAEQRVIVGNWLPGVHQFQQEHLRGDAGSWVELMASVGKLPEPQFMKRDSVDELFSLLNAKIARAIDGKMAMVKSSDNAAPMTGRFPPGTISKQEFAEMLLQESNATRDPTPLGQVSQYVSSGFADYLEAVGEVIVRERETVVWIAPDTAYRDRVLNDAYLVAYGANNTSTVAKGSVIHEIVERLYPREKRVWEKGLAGSLLMVDAVRSEMTNAIQALTAGSFSMREVGGHMVAAMHECHQAMNRLVEAEPEQTLVPARLAMEKVWEELDIAHAQLKLRPSLEPFVAASLTTSIDAVNYTIQVLAKREHELAHAKLPAPITAPDAIKSHANASPSI